MRQDSAATADLVYSAESFINTILFGMAACSSNWKFPMEDGKLTEVKFANWRARRIVESINDLIDICLFDEHERNRWKVVCAEYRHTIKVCLILFLYIYNDFRLLTFYCCYFFQLLQQKSDFTDDDIDAFQASADSFFSKWLDLCGYDGITNYIHLLGAGHIRYFLSKWRNLNRY
jgi:hypothetical protein